MAKRAAKAVAPDPVAAARARFIEQGSDPAIAEKALEDAASLSRGLWLSFLTFGTYLVITFAGVTHRDLLLEEPITLPVLNAKLPLVTFFWVAPILFVIFHLYLLLSLKLLADQVHSYVEQLAESGLDQDAQDRARLQLPNFVLVQVLGGTSDQVKSWAGWLLSFTAFLTLVAGPLILLLFAQLMFLPYHGWWVTMAQRVMVVIDLVFIWYFWRAITRPEREGLHFGSGAASAAVIALAFFGFMYPGELFYGLLPKLMFDETGFDSANISDEAGINLARKEVGLAVFYNTLVLPGERLVDDDLFKKLDARNLEKNLDPWRGERSIAEVLKNRDFRQADFVDIDLRKAELSGAVFDNAQLSFASLQGARLNLASLQGASLDRASLQGALLRRAKLQGASLVGASLQGALLRRASLQGASLDRASLQGASLDKAILQGESLAGARLQGASLPGARLQGASLDGATLQGASLWKASLQGASLAGALLQGTSLVGANVWRSSGQPETGPTDVTELVLSLNLAPHHDAHHGMTQEAYEALVKEALEGVPQSALMSIRRRLAVLDPQVTPKPEELTNWPKVMNAMAATPDFKAQLVNSLIATACETESAPHVAQGIVRAWFDPKYGGLRADALPLVKQRLLGCHGTKGMDQATIIRLE